MQQPVEQSKSQPVEQSTVPPATSSAEGNILIIAGCFGVEENAIKLTNSYNIAKQHGYKFSWEKYDGNELKYKVMADMLYHDTLALNSWKIDPYAIRHIDGREESIVKGRNLDTIINLYPTLAASDGKGRLGAKGKQRDEGGIEEELRDIEQTQHHTRS